MCNYISLYSTPNSYKRNESHHSSCMTCNKRCRSLFSELRPAELENIDLNKFSYKLKIYKEVYQQGSKSQGLHILSSGKVKLSVANEGGMEYILSIHGPADFLGIHDILNTGYYSSTATTLEDSTICFIPTDIINGLISKNNDLSNKICQQLARDLVRSQSRFIAKSSKYMRSRLADTLLYIIDIFGYSKESGWLDIELKRHEFAALSNMTEANAIRILSEFNRSGIIEISGRKIKILKVDSLHKLSIQGI